MSGVVGMGRALAETQKGRDELPRIAVVGCGAIAERYHLPALARLPAVLERAVLVDPAPSRRRDLADRFGVRDTAADLGDVLDDVQGAIVATPPSTHKEICSALLDRGISVLCEKPLTEAPGEAHALIEQAAATGASLCVNHTRRLFPASGKIRELLRAGELGQLRSIEYVDGNRFRWPAATGFHFRAGARGVLLDRGVHSLDLICWWLGSKPRLTRSFNDSYGGPESIAWLELFHDACRINVKLSWITNLQNYFRLHGDGGTITSGVEDWEAVRITRPSGRIETISTPASASTYAEFGTLMVSNFVDVLAGDAEPAVPATEVVASIELIDQAYATAQRLDRSWAFDVSSDG